jgi:cell wall-associated NlpC family hydrolase
MVLDDPNLVIDTLLQVPYRPGGSEIWGADCWGIVELWYDLALGIKLDDRSNHEPGEAGLQAGFNAAQHWQKIEQPEDHCLVIMRAKGFEAGHVGVFYGGSVLHSDEQHGCVYQPISDRFIRSKITRFLKHT